MFTHDNLKDLITSKQDESKIGPFRRGWVNILRSLFLKNILML